MAVNDYKITDTTNQKVSDEPGSTLSGTVAQNKAVFDKLGLFIIEKYNGLIDYLRSKGIDTATSTATTTTNGLMAATDKTKLNSLTTATATTSAAGYMSATDKTKLNTLETNFNKQFETDTYTIAVINGGTNTGSYSISKSGYKPVAIAGFSTSNTDMFVNRLRISSGGVGSGTIAWGCTNTEMRQTSEQLVVYVLWIKNTI